MKGSFAPEYSVNDKGWYLFPRDDHYRKSIFPVEVMEHKAKANLFMLQAIVEYVSEGEQTILDPMAGTGSIMVATLIGREVIMIELEESFQNIIQKGIDKIDIVEPGLGTLMLLIPGNCIKVLPVPADHIIFSPPYASALKKKSIDKFTAETLGEKLLDYTKSPENIGNLGDFFYNHKMEDVYKKCYECLPDGGSMTVIIKDRIKGGKRVGLIDWLIRCCSAIGFKLHKVYEWLPPGTPYINIRRARGETVVDEEAIVIFEK